jgi:signal transduction histidine kinase
VTSHLPQPGAERLPVLVPVGLGLAAATLALPFLPAIPQLDPATVALLLVVVLLAEVWGFELFQRSSYSISTVPIVAAAILLGAAGVLVVAPTAMLIRGLRRRSRWYKVLCNASAHAIGGVAAALVYQLGSLGRPPAPEHALFLAAPGALAGLAFYYVHSGITALGMATELRRSPLRVWGETFRWLWPHYAVLGLMGLLLALAYRLFGPVGAAVFLVPPLMMHHVARQYVERAQDRARLAEQAAHAAALEELNRLKSEFISIASHELRTPLTSIQGFSELLLDETTPPQERRRWLSFINADAKQLSALVDNLLDTSRIETGRIAIDPAAVDLGEVLPPLLDRLVAASPRHRWAFEVAPGTPQAWVDPEKLRQIVANLVGNALKYSPRGGEVRVTVAAASAGARVVVSVSDQGVGIPADQFDRIFDRFQRVTSPTTRATPGTGLGLYVVKSLVELHGGAVDVESTIGLGSTFRVILPAGAPLPSRAPSAADPVVAPVEALTEP